MPTERLYMTDMSVLESTGSVLSVETEGDAHRVVLDRSPMYPQGGGQPADHGVITGSRSSFHVEDVRSSVGEVVHSGTFEGSPFEPGESVTVSVDAERRTEMNRLHSAGHLIDMAVLALGHDWTPARGYHFPDGPYVEYTGDAADVDPDQLARKIERECTSIVSRNLPTSIRFVAADSGDPALRFLPPGLSGGEAVRVVSYGDFGVPCGGTHVAATADVGDVRIRRIRSKKGTIRVAYALD